DGTSHSVTGSVAGIPGAIPSLTYSDSTGHSVTAPTNAGTYTVTGSYVDSTNFVSATGTGTLTIAKASQSITWSDPLPITYVTALSATQLNATVAGVSGGSPPGALAYSPGVGMPLGPGLGQALTVTAAATNNYNQATKTVHIDVLDRPAAVGAITAPL